MYGIVCEAMNKIINVLRAQSVLILFYFVITTSLFLGDGKQPLIDVVWACEILFLYAIFHLQNRTTHVLPRALEMAWFMLLGYCIIRSSFSDSVGYSLSAIVRLFSAYLIYRLFYSIADKNHTPRVVLGIIIIGAVATIVSFGCLLFPQFVSQLPQMNLLYASYGHNQLAGLLLFGIPMIIEGGAPIPPRYKKTVFILFLSGIIFSFARGAWILLAAYFAFLLVTKRPVGKFNTSIIVVYMGAITALLITMFLLVPRLAHEPQISGNVWLYKQTIKPPIYESRIRYWLQAASAIRERPIFGSGPGTFYLQSKRLQDVPLSYSWFAHSFVLEQFVEIGLVGMVLWGILFVIQGRLLIRSRNRALLAGVILTFLYSLFEYNLNFLVIWLLFWSVLGWLTGSAQLKKTSSPGPSFFVTGGIVLLFVFSLLSVGSTIATMGNNSDVASLFTPFVADVAETSIENHSETATAIPQNHLSLLLFFHKKNPEILQQLAKYFVAQRPPLAFQFYKKTIIADPQNSEIYKEYVEESVKENSLTALGSALKAISVLRLPPASLSTLSQVNFSNPLILSVIKMDLFADTNRLLSSNGFLAKLYYFVGMASIESDPAQTRYLWMLARDADPSLGYYSAELASLDVYVLNDPVEAKHVLTDCQKDFRAKELCRVTLEYFSEMPAVGSYNNDILQIQ
jgi:O-antigen ligase